MISVVQVFNLHSFGEMNSGRNILGELYYKRYEAFRNLEWDIESFEDRLQIETDGYDTPYTVHLIFNEKGRILSGLRLNPTVKPNKYMLQHEAFSSNRRLIQRKESLVQDNRVGELSRYFISSSVSDKQERRRINAIMDLARGEIMKALNLEYCLFLTYPSRFENYKKHGWKVSALGEAVIGGDGSQFMAGRLHRMSDKQLKNQKRKLEGIRPILNIPKISNGRNIIWPMEIVSGLKPRPIELPA